MRYRLCATVVLLCGLAGPLWADPGDERIVAARDAATRGDAQKLELLAAAPSDHVLEPYVNYWLLSAGIARLSQPAPEDEIAAFLQRHAGSWPAEKLRTEWARRLAREERWSQFSGEYALLGQPDQELQCYAIRAGGESGFQALQALLTQWESLLDAPEACRLPLQSLLLDGTLNADAGWERFRRLVEAKRFSAAQRTLGWLTEAQSLNAATVQMALENPASFLASPGARRPVSRADRELVLAAVARLARSDVDEAAAQWAVLGGADFGGRERAYVMGQLGWMAAIRQLPQANEWFSRARDVRMSAEQHAWQVRAALRAGDWRAVHAAIEEMPSAQREQPDWTYWLGRSLREQGRPGDAQALFERIAGEPTFYGILSSEALGRRFVWPRPAAQASAEEIEQMRGLGAVRRAEALMRLDMRTESAREWNWALRGADDRVLLVAAEYARRSGLYDRAINTAERTRSQHDFALRYLAPYYDVFASQARANSLDLAWVYGLVRQESRFLSVARSGVGAQGLMQVMPSTGRWIAKKSGIDNFSPASLTRIDTNVQVGTAYLGHVLSSLDNLPVLASAAYNAGPGRARRWRDSKTLEGAVYAETIPITETREYVKKVMANSVIYATLFDDRSALLERRLGQIPPQAASADDDLAGS